MDAVGAIANIIAIVDLVKELVLLGKYLKDTVGEAAGNFHERRELVNSIYESLVSLEPLSNGRKPETTPPELYDSLQSLQRHLKDCVAQCKKAFEPQSRFGKYGDRFMLWMKRDDITTMLESLHRSVMRAHAIFTTSAVARIEDRMPDIMGILNRIDGKIERHPCTSPVSRNKLRQHAQPTRGRSTHEKVSNGRDTLLQVPRDMRRPSSSSSKRPPLDIHAEEKRRPSSVDRNTGVTIRVQSISAALSERPSLDSDGARPMERTPSVKSRVSATSSVDSRMSLTHYGHTGDPAAETEQTIDKLVDVLCKIRDTKTSRSDVARDLDKLSVALSDIGMNNEAIEISAWSVRTFDELTFSLDLPHATALFNQANHLFKHHGKEREALESCRKAKELYRRCIDSGDELCRADLARCLNLETHCLNQLDRTDDALRTAASAVDIYLALSTQHPDSFDADLAMASNTVGNVHLLRRHPAEALHSLEKAVDIYRRLANKEPDRFKPAFATSLSTYASCLRSLRRYDDALRHAKDAVSIHTDLARHRPQVFKEHLAHSNRCVFDILSSLHRHTDALEYIEDAVEAYRELKSSKPHKFKPLLATSLRLNAYCLIDMKRFDKARRIVEELLVIFGALEKEDAATYKPQLAGAFDMAYICFSAMQRHTEATNAAKEAVTIYHALSTQNPSEYQTRLAECSFHVSRALHTRKKHDDALHAAKEAVRIYSQLGGDEASRYALALTHLSDVQSHLDRFQDALNSAKKAQGIYQKMKRDQRDVGYASDVEFCQKQIAFCKRRLDSLRSATDGKPESGRASSPPFKRNPIRRRTLEMIKAMPKKLPLTGSLSTRTPKRLSSK
ncbi:hypothetical protein PLICRDRAFT_35121 [Plicaturopsis crispa FD-325 SS-3]|nr:hypothetical protein PLICRDRAFT_35121 [Plicaturopsis crispa FD-325 SS-3]